MVLALVGACSSHRQQASSSAAASRGAYKIGQPYTVDGVTYVPKEEFRHTETGVASWYGPGFHGKYTANGEVYNQSDHTAAHRTLQMPSVLRVTNLDNGQSTVVRVNDRGPFARSRVLDVSRAAAEELGMVGNGTARVRIEQLEAESLAMKQVAVNGGGPDEQRAELDGYLAGRRSPPPTTAVAQVAPPPPAPPPPAPPPPMPAPAPPPTPPVTVYPSKPPEPVAIPVAASAPAGNTLGAAPTVASLATAAAVAPPPSMQSASGFFVQTGAFSTMGNAERQKGQVTSYGAAEISQGASGGREVYRVRLGPYSTQEAAGIVADRLRRSGYGDARVVAN